MPRLGKIELSIPRRLLLLTAIPIIGLMIAGGTFFRTLYTQYQEFTRDAGALAAYHAEVDAFVHIADVIGAEREAALRLFYHREDPQALEAYRARFAETDRAVTELYARLDRLAASPAAKFFAEKDQAIRSFFAAQIPDVRASTLESKRSAGAVFSAYMKIAYSALGICEATRSTVHTPQGYNLFDSILAMQKVHIQETMATSLALHALQHGGLQKDELAILRRQYFISTENEYYMLKFQPELRAYFRTTTRKTEDDTAFYQYLADVSGTQAEKTPFPAFKPKSGTVAELEAAHFRAYDDVFRYAFAFADQALTKAAAECRRHALLVGAGLIAGIVFSLGVNLAITRSTRRSLVHVANNIDRASDDVKAASSQLTLAGDRISDDATRYAAAIDGISTSLGEVAQVAETNKGHATKATTTTMSARDSVDAGLGTIQQLDTAMNSARTSAQKINQVISRINDLSFQTNLLALNAAVEAARAGEAGAGFAVVADEVRRLAGRCAEAARETAELIGESTKDTGTAIAKSDDLAKRFKEVSETIHQVNELVSLMSTNFTQQAASIGAINHSVSGQREIAQSLVTAAGETAGTARSMEAQVDSLETNVARMDHLLGEQRAQSRAAQPCPASIASVPAHPTPGPRRSAKPQRRVAASV